jgi:hypothetical protein
MCGALKRLLAYWIDRRAKNTEAGPLLEPASHPGPRAQGGYLISKLYSLRCSCQEGDYA